MFNPWLTLAFKTIELGIEAQSVIALRMMRLAAGGARGRAEATRMVAEKVGALAEAQTAAAAAILTGRREKVVAGKVLNAYKKRVGANTVVAEMSLRAG